MKTPSSPCRTSRISSESGREPTRGGRNGRRDFGEGAATEYLRYVSSPLGRILLSSDGEALTGLWFEGQKYFGAGLPAHREERQLPLFEEAERWLTDYFGGRAPDFTPPLAPRGTPFRRAVWEHLLTVPYGRTVTYGGIAAALAGQAGSARVSARAVGGAVGHNPISLIIPCHRVVGADGSLTGYAGGTDRKARLLALEGALSGGDPGKRERT